MIKLIATILSASLIIAAFSEEMHIGVANPRPNDVPSSKSVAEPLKALGKNYIAVGTREPLTIEEISKYDAAVTVWLRENGFKHDCQISIVAGAKLTRSPYDSLGMCNIVLIKDIRENGPETIGMPEFMLYYCKDGKARTLQEMRPKR